MSLIQLSMRELSLLSLIGFIAACPDVSSTSVPPPACPTTATADTERVFDGLKPICEGCHVAGERGYFASLEAFQSLLVSDARYVVPGDPGNSVLVALLKGTSRGAFAQMPPSGDTYAVLAANGAATVSIDDVEGWITALANQVRDPSPDKNAPRITRVTANQVRVALYQQLGLDAADFFIPAYEFGIEMAEARGDDNYPLLSPDDLPAPRQGTTEARHANLGGFSIVAQQTADREPSGNYVNTLVQLSQRWCRMAIDKPGNTALFAEGTSSADESEANVTSTVKRWSRLFHAIEIDDAEAKRLYTELFVPLRADPAADTTSAWSGVCSYFIRHPSWVFY